MTQRTRQSAFSIVQDGNAILLTKRKDVPVWVLPGGGVEAGENPGQAAAREVLEETGVTIRITSCCGYYLPINRLARETYVFHSTPVGGSPILSEETSAVGYFPLDKLPADLFAVHRGWIQEWRSGKMTTRKLTEVTYLELLKYAMSHPWITARFLVTRLTR